MLVKKNIYGNTFYKRNRFHKNCIMAIIINTFIVNFIQMTLNYQYGSLVPGIEHPKSIM